MVATLPGELWLFAWISGVGGGGGGEQNWANRKAGAEEARTPVQVLEERSFNVDTKP